MSYPGAVATKDCTVCGLEPKKAGHPRWCYECWLSKQQVSVRSEKSKARLALVPEGQRLARVPQEHWPTNRRWCAGCQSFVLLKHCSGSRCKDCASVAAHRSRLKSTYVLGGRPFTDEDFDALMEIQDGRCYLCNRAAGKRRLAIDHDHKSNEVRGLLCNDSEFGCNLKVVARFDGDPDPLAMVERLRLYLSGETPARKLLVSPP